MADLLKRYGLVPDLSKRFSISFVDNFVDCSYRVFLSYFMGLWPERQRGFTRIFGTGCHRGLAAVNKLVSESFENELCSKCLNPCKLWTVQKVEAMKVPLEKCAVKQLMMDEFFKEFTPEFEEAALREEKDKPIDEIKEEILDHHRYAYNCMCSTMFESQPVGEVLMTEEMLKGTLGDHNILGQVDLALGIQQGDKIPKTLVVDYKTTGTMPTKKLPIRQLALYVHLLEQKGLTVNGVSAIYMVKKDPPKVKRKNSKDFLQSKTFFESLDRDRTGYKMALDGIKEDMDQIADAISCGNFVRNRNSMFCESCDQKKYCENPYLLDKAIEMGQTKVTKNKKD